MYASFERLFGEKQEYNFVPLTKEIIATQKRRVWKSNTTFSVLVPAYETPAQFMRALIDSVLNQTYSRFELIIADASSTNTVRKTVEEYSDARIRYIKLSGNGGISKNTNEGLKYVNGDYVVLLDHDDVLTADALYENASMIESGRDIGIEYAFIYSDEDKCDGNGENFREPNIKPSFNLDLLLSNNYICHLLVMKASLMKELKFRVSYDGAQDHDIILRAYAATCEKASENRIEYGHISKVLYHWRCHNDSTAANPKSKMYAYEAGRRAVADYLKKAGITANVEHTKHNGFFRVEYTDNYVYPPKSKHKRIKDSVTVTDRGAIAYNTLLNRYDIGAIGGPIFSKNKITGGAIDITKTCPYDGLDRHFSGYLHRATLQQGVMALDVRNMMMVESLASILVRYAREEEYRHIFNQDLIDELDRKVQKNNVGVPFIDVTEYISTFDYDNYEYVKASVALGREIAFEGYLNYYDPMLYDEE